MRINWEKSNNKSDNRSYKSKESYLWNFNNNNKEITLDKQVNYKE
jgi:hypothetical protein